MKLSELQEEFWRKEHEVTEERLVRGALILTILSEEDGITFNNGRTSKPYGHFRKNRYTIYKTKETIRN